MKITEHELVLKIGRAHEVSNECVKRYGGSKYAFLAGAYEAVFCELLGISDFDKLLEKLGEKC